MPPLSQTLASLSPRLSPQRVPLVSSLIHGGVLALFVILSTRAFVQDGIFAWSSGLIYILYDTVLLIFVFRQTLPLLEPAKPLRDQYDALSLGVIVAAYNEGLALPATIASIVAQDAPPDEILIADDGSNDETADVLAHHFGLIAPPIGEMSAPSPSHPSLRWLKLHHRGKAQALNAAIPNIHTDIVVTIDADTILSRGAISAMRGAFGAEPGLVAATGVLIPVCSPTTSGALLQWFQNYEYIRNFISRFAWMSVDSLLLISGAFAGFRRQALMTVGGFDPECLVEDYEVIHRLHRYSADNGLGWRVRVLGTATAQTEAPATVPAFLRQRRRWFAGFLQTQYWNRDMLGNKRYGQLGTLMLPIKAVDTLQPIYGLTAFVLLLVFFFMGKIDIAAPAFSVITAKIVLDIAFYFWSIRLYSRWVGDAARINYVHAAVAAIIEPFSFQLLRHAGAALGWVTFFSGKNRWSGVKTGWETRA